MAGDRNQDKEEFYFSIYKTKQEHNYPNRWNNHLGVPKHLIPIKGEPLIHRTQRLLAQYGATNIEIKCNPDNFSKYLLPGSVGTAGLKNNSIYDDHEFFSAAGLFNDNGITVMLFGDIYYSESLIKYMVENDSEDWFYYGRQISSVITGKEYGEHWGWHFHTKHIQPLTNCAERACAVAKQLIKQYEEDPEGTKYPWTMEETSKMCYRAMANIDLMDPHLIEDKHWIEWDDETEDFDYPEDWDKWAKNLPHLAY